MLAGFGDSNDASAARAAEEAAEEADAELQRMAAASARVDYARAQRATRAVPPTGNLKARSSIKKSSEDTDSKNPEVRRPRVPFLLCSLWKCC